jgi:quinol monooxygenase YgiN
MTDPIVYIDRSEIVEGQLDALTARIGELAQFVEANEPRLLAYAVYLDRDLKAISVIHVHRDAASLDTHFRVAGPAFRQFVDYVRLQSIDVFGDPSADVVRQLREKARLLGNATVAVHPYHAGFLRSEVSATKDDPRPGALGPWSVNRRTGLRG